MKEGTVTARGLSKSNKLTVSIDGEIYYPGKTDMSSVHIGDRISYEPSSFVFNGKTFWGINSWKLLGAAQKYPPSQQPPREIAAPTASSAPQGGITDAERPFISNCVAHAIASGAIKEPEQIEKWVSAAKNALRSQSE